MSKLVQVSVVIPVLQRVDDLAELYDGYTSALDKIGKSYEVLFIVDGGNDAVVEQLDDMRARHPGFKTVLLAKFFGESTVLSAGFDEAQGEAILTLPAYHQIEPESIERVFRAYEGCDLVIARRWPRAGSLFESFRRKTFHYLLKSLSGEDYNDLGCGVRLFSRQLVDEIHLYGDLHRFFPVLASRQGFNVVEVDVAQSPKDDFLGRYRLREYLHRVLDIVTVFFLVRFTKKPLRFFGMVGSVVSALGAIVVFTLVVQRLFFAVGLADRPALLLGSLLLVLGVQIFALGLIGELIIFTHAGGIKEYTVAETVPAEFAADMPSSNAR
jgi:glycosyltransferase involved in cell wall biosynthesis